MAAVEKEVLEREEYLNVMKEMMKFDTHLEPGYKETAEKKENIEVDPTAELDEFLVQLRDYHTNQQLATGERYAFDIYNVQRY